MYIHFNVVPCFVYWGGYLERGIMYTVLLVNYFPSGGKIYAAHISLSIQSVSTIFKSSLEQQQHLPLNYFYGLVVQGLLLLMIFFILLIFYL